MIAIKILVTGFAVMAVFFAVLGIERWRISDIAGALWLALVGAGLVALVTVLTMHFAAPIV
jgi:hypothetical protein